MNLLDRLAEKHIDAAVRKGELDNLPGAGKPLELEDLSLVPESLRAAYILLKNSGHLPPELQLRREIASLETLIAAAGGVASDDSRGRRLRFLKLQLGLCANGALSVEEQYGEALLQRFSPASSKDS